ncbi:endonuclease [Tenacibaculum aiptasiae]|uniref:endonuclease n=1 Tax=Tenacibaculum aiptasiae TaxID=426481 RepID=UPI003B5CC8D6
MKKLLPFVFLIASLSVFSQQIPSYYNDVNLNQTGAALKDALAVKIIGSHTSILTYTPGVWNALKQTDLDPTDNTKVVLIYGWNDSDSDITNDRTRGKDNHGGGSGVWNREHVYSKSLANPNLGTSGPGADAHNLRPCDAQRNSSRSNRKFAAGSGNSGATPQGNWYPGDEWKGDVARMMMYMYLRYGNQSLPTGVGVGNTVATDPNMIDLFLQWNAEDPVSDLEKQRNPVLEQLQGNRNPFIDNPALATQIWGGPQAEDLFGNGGNTDTQAPTTPSGLVASNITQTTVDLAWTASTDNTAVTGYNIFNGSTQVATSTSTSTTVTGLTAGTSYNFTVKAYDAAANVSAASNAVSVTTTSGGSGGNGTATELLFSEYVEGSSYNKAIEIANFTGATVDLSGYSIKKATNGGGTWSNTLTLTGQLNNGDVFVIAHSSASTTVKNKAQLTNSSVMNFNGNDAVALFKGSTLIDIIGDQNNSANFGKDQTFQRKSSVKSPNTTYTVAEWNTLAKDTFSGLGSHTIDGGSSADTTAPSAPSNLVTSNLTQTTVNLAWTASMDNVGVTGYEVYQNDSKIATVTTVSYAVTGLSADTAYNYSIKAIDAAGNISALSNKVFITTLSIPDTTAPSAPSSLTASNVTQTSVNLAWTASTDNVGVSGYDVFRGSTKITTVTSTNYTVTNLTAGTNYTFSVKAKDQAGNISTASNVIGVTTKSPTITYCDSKGSNVNYEYIDNVAIGGISNVTSANGGYGDFTSQTANIAIGSNTIVVSAGFASSSYTEYWKVWIDFNQNGTFESSEEVVSGSSSSAGNLSYNFTVPSSATLGTTRMRVSMKWNAAPTPCETISYGEVEDYTVNISNSSKAMTTVQIDGQLGNEEPIFDAKVYPNPSTDYIVLKLADGREANYKITNYVGQTVMQGKINRQIDIRDLNTGMYIIEVNDNQRSFTKKFMKK